MDKSSSRPVLPTSTVITDENRLVLSGLPGWEEEAFRLAADLSSRYAGVGVDHLKKIVTTALEIIGSRTVVSPETVIIPELGEGFRAAPDG